MNRLEIAVALLTGNFHSWQDRQDILIKTAFSMADKIIEYNKLTHPVQATSTADIHALIESKIDNCKPPKGWMWMQAKQFLILCGFDEPNNNHAAIAATYLKSKNGNASKRVNGKKLFLCPPLK